MAEVITRFKLETTQYDSKLRDAAKGLKEYTSQATMAGNEFGKFTQKNVEAARSFGSIETSATNAKDRVKELVGAYNDVAKAYNDLTKEQQQSDFGKAMSESLDKLKGRIGDTKKELYDLGNSGKGTGGILDALAQKLNVNVDALKLLDIGLTAVNGALSVAKDAFFASEASVDEWGRTTASAQALYEGFLTSLNNGDISGYLNNINDIIIAARQAYNELDKLGTMKTIQAPGMSRQQLENERMRMMIMTGRYIRPQDGRPNDLWGGQLMKEGQLLTPGQIKMLERRLQNGMNNITKLVKNEVDQSGKAIDAYYNSLAKQNGMSLQEFRRGTSNWDEFSKRMAGYEKYKEYQDQAAREFYKNGGQGFAPSYDKSNPYLEFKKWGTFRVDKEGENSYNDLVNLIKTRDQQIGQVYSTISQSYRTINRAEGITVRSIMGGGGRSGSGGQNDIVKEKSIAQEIADLEKEAYTADEKRRGEIALLIQALDKELERQKAIKNELHGIVKEQKQLAPGLSGLTDASISYETRRRQSKLAGMEWGSAEYNRTAAGITDLSSLQNIFKQANNLDIAISPTTREQMMESILNEEDIRPMLTNLVDLINSTLEEGVEPIKINFETGDIIKASKKIDNTQKGEKKEEKNYLTDGVSKLSSGLSGLKTGLESLGVEFGEHFDKVINGITVVTGILSSISTIVLAIEAISATDAIIPFARGGIVQHAASGYRVPGNNFSGDLVPAMLNSGELVLNRAQQGVLANAIQNGGMSGIYLETRISAEDIRLVLNNNGRRTGYGEYVQTRRR